MGRKMDDIHAPTVSAGPRSDPAAPNGPNIDELSLIDLVAEKDRVEGELKALSRVLDSHGVNMNTSLTTFDGYPRDDLDIAQIRTTRARIIYLQNDYKRLMSKIEVGLHAHHAEMQRASPRPTGDHTQSSSGMQNTNATDQGLIETPFAKVNSVVEGSPADAAGLRAGDRIKRFGRINWLNHERLSKVSEMVQRNEGRSIAVKVLRGGDLDSIVEELQLSLTPRRDWGGRGTLGCHLVPA